MEIHNYRPNCTCAASGAQTSIELGLSRSLEPVSHYGKNLTGAVSGTAAVVGVILSLAVVFGAALIFPQGFYRKS